MLRTTLGFGTSGSFSCSIGSHGIPRAARKMGESTGQTIVLVRVMAISVISTVPDKDVGKMVREMVMGVMFA